MALVKNGAFTTDEFMKIDEAAPLPGSGPIIVSLKRFLEHRDALLTRNAPIGVRLEASESPEALGQDVHRLAIVALNFPSPRDGRAFSWARMLRVRMGFKGELRATGHYLLDHLAFLRRVGVDSFELPDSVSQADVDASLHAFSHVYQRAVDGQKTIWDLRLAK